MMMRQGSGGALVGRRDALRGLAGGVLAAAAIVASLAASQLGCGRPAPPARHPPAEPGAGGGEARGVELYQRAELFLNDDVVVADSKGVEVELARPRKHPGNPVLIPERPWESGYFGYCTVVHDLEEKLYKVWYETRNDGVSRLLYAVSKDGLTWEKPAVGSIEFEGSRANNIVYQASTAATSTKVYHVIKDPADPEPGRRYKMMYQYGDSRGLGIAMGYSPDGQHWTGSRSVNLYVANDTQNVFFFDDRLGHYVGYFRHWMGGNRRHIARGVSYDGFHWSLPVRVHGPDRADPPDRDLYVPGVFKYRRASSVYVMLTSVLDGTSNKMFAQCALSRDGIRWHRFREPFLPNGAEGAWDSGAAIAAAAEVSVGDQTAVYYEQCGYWFFGDEDRAAKQPTGHGTGGRPGLGVAFIPEGGFVGWRADSEGTLLTQPLELVDVVADDEICVDAVASGGSIRAELLDEGGGAIPGFSLRESEEVRGSGRLSPLRWRGQHFGQGESPSSLQVAARRGRVRLKLHLRNATVFGLSRRNPTHKLLN